VAADLATVAFHQDGERILGGHRPQRRHHDDVDGRQVTQVHRHRDGQPGPCDDLSAGAGDIDADRRDRRVDAGRWACAAERTSMSAVSPELKHPSLASNPSVHDANGSNTVVCATGPPGSDARRVLVAAGTWLAARRRGTQRLAGLRGGAAAAGRMAPVAPPPGRMCYSGQHRHPGNPGVSDRGNLAPATLTPAAARSSRPGSPWPPARRRAGGDLVDRGRSGPPRLRARGGGLERHAVRAIAGSPPG